MKEFIHELIIIGTYVGTLICREIIVILKKYRLFSLYVLFLNFIT